MARPTRLSPWASGDVAVPVVLRSLAQTLRGLPLKSVRGSPAPLRGFGVPPRPPHSFRRAFYKGQPHRPPDSLLICVPLSPWRPGWGDPGDTPPVPGAGRLPPGAPRAPRGAVCRSGRQPPRPAGPGAEGLREKAPGAGVAEQVRNYTLRTSAPQVLGLLAQRRDGGPSPAAGPGGPWVAWCVMAPSLSLVPRTGQHTP